MKQPDPSLLACFALLIASLAGCTDTPPAGLATGGTVAGWPAYGATPGGTHFSQADQINPDNVKWLTQAWVHNSGDMRTASSGDGEFLSQTSFQVTPILIEDTLYYCSPFNRVFALDAETGEERWSYDPKVDMDSEAVLPNCRGVSSWRSGAAGFCEHRIITATLDARMIALDGATGKPCPDFGNGGEVDMTPGISRHLAMEYGVTSPPAIINDLAVTGAMVLDNQRIDAPSGVVRAYDVRTGELAWAWNPVPPDMAPRDPDGNFRSGTTNVWSIIAVDEARNLVFIPTGNTNPDYYGGHREGLDAYSSSVIALDADSGRIVWQYQMVHHDLWDYDTPAQPTLIDLEVDGQTVPALVQVTKMGMTFVLNRETGEPIYPVEERPVPQNPVPGEYLSATQPFPSHLPYLFETITADDAWGFTFWDEGACRDSIAGLRNEGIYTPPSLEGSILLPSNGGGNNWGSPAIDPERKIMAVITWRVAAWTKLIPRKDCPEFGQTQAGTPYCVDTGLVMSPLGVPCTEPPWATIDAIDLVSGELLWSVPLGTSRNMAPFPFWWIKGVPGIGGLSITGSGLVFVGAASEHKFRALSAATGETLWEGDIPTAANSTPMTYQLKQDGRQFVVVAAGGHWSGINPPGDHLIAFALPD